MNCSEEERKAEHATNKDGVPICRCFAPANWVVILCMADRSSRRSFEQWGAAEDHEDAIRPAPQTEQISTKKITINSHKSAVAWVEEPISTENRSGVETEKTTEDVTRDRTKVMQFRRW